jgi:hypothetical protein
MKSFTRAISNIIKSQPYQTGRYFDKDNIMVLNELGDTFYYDKTTGDCTLRVNGISTVLPTGGEMSDEMLVSLNGQLINQKILLLNFVLEGEIHVTALSVIEEWGGDGDANPNRMFDFPGTKPTLLLDDRYSANGDVDAVVFYCIEKNERYFLAKRLFSENFENEHLLFTIDKELYESPDRISFSFNTEYSGMYRIKKDDAVVTPPGPIACIPTTRNFVNNPVNYNLVSTVDMIYQFYAIVEAQGQRFFVRAEDYAVPTEPIAGRVYYNDEMVQMDLTAAATISVFLSPMSISATSFNESYQPINFNGAYVLLLRQMGFHYNIEPLMTPNESWVVSKLNGFSTTSNVPADLNGDQTEGLGLRFHAEQFSVKFVHATNEELQRYGIVNTGSRRCINIIDYMNNANELVTLSCAKIGLDTDPNIDNVSTINCDGAPTEYIFGLQQNQNISDFSGSLQITDTVTGLSKKYKFEHIHTFLTSYTLIDMISFDFPTYYSGEFSGDTQWVIYAETYPAERDNTHPLKIMIKMNAANALFYNNGSNHLEFCLNVSQLSNL